MGPALGFLVALATSVPAVATPAGSPARRGGGGSVAPGPGGQEREARYGCLTCHADKRRAYRLGVHSERGLRCDDCHGGNPRAFDADSAHRGDFVGATSGLGTVAVCAACHSDPDRMRQYGLPADQEAELRKSRHGELLFGRADPGAPTCTRCHDPHTTLRADDARSTVYPMNIPDTCASCHADSAHMAPYGIPTDQFARYRESAHGIELYERRNFAAPSCVGCHGSHAALPPKVTEIANVCGRCHVNVRRAFYAGPHVDASSSGRIPGCTACHSNHGTEGIPPENLAATCERCHGPDSREATLGLELQQRVLRATEEMDGAARAIRQLVRDGKNVDDLRFRYQTALTETLQIAQVQHSLDLDRLEELSRRVGSISRDIRGAAEASAEEKWEHKLLLLPLWLVALSSVTLAWFRLHRLS